MSRSATCLWARAAWLPEGWANDVVLRIGASGRWSEVAAGVTAPPVDAVRLTGPVLPGLVDAHSHAFQRAFAGQAEGRDGDRDDFWSWRMRMYRVASRVTPEQLRAIATQLYVELLYGGYTQVCEFHYLRNDRDGQPYADPYALSWALADAADLAGLGLTLMPTLYGRAGFAQERLNAEQQRFASDAASTRAHAEAIARSGRSLLRAGLAVHSLRAAAPASIHELHRFAQDFDGPIHIHVAEQADEVDACMAATGARPVAWLAREGLLDARWHLVHATHTVPKEIDAVARSGAGIVICPATEANLGDGFADLPGWLASGVPLAVGSDSHVTRDWREELRCLEYGQRLLRRQRNVSAESRAPGLVGRSSAARLWQRVQMGSAAAAGEATWGLVAGARADALIPDAQDPALVGVPISRLLDALVYSSPTRPWAEVMVAGHWVVRDGRHPRARRIAQEFSQAMATLSAAD